MLDVPLAHGGRLQSKNPLVMGILNATPDSFSDGGQLVQENVGAIARHWHEQGVGVFDVGGESTRPGHEEVPADLEIQRVVPVVQQIRKAVPGAVISIDTRKASVARAALDGGASFVNDVSGMDDPGMPQVLRDFGCAYVLMRHNDLAGDVVMAAMAELDWRVQRALDAGIERAQILVDPGLGFGAKPGADVGANLALVDAAGSFGYPCLIGASRKRFIGEITGTEVPRERLAGNLAVALRAAAAGAAMIRVHDAVETVQALRAWSTHRLVAS